MPEVIRIAKQHHLKVVEDCAQSFGATWQNQQTGSFGDVACYSFYPSKNLSCFGDGGLVATNNDELYNDLVALRNHGSYTRYHHEKLGYNSRLDELQATILRIKLRHLDRFNQQRQRVAKEYTERLQNSVSTPKPNSQGKHIYHQYTILHPKRDEIHAALKAADIASAVYYPIPIHRQPLFHDQYKDLDLPVTEELTTQCLSLPIYPELTTQQIDKICAVIKRVTHD